jgi:hypothetical protein
LSARDLALLLAAATHGSLLLTVGASHFSTTRSVSGLLQQSSTMP